MVEVGNQQSRQDSTCYDRRECELRIATYPAVTGWE